MARVVPATEAAVRDAAAELAQGRLVAFPTETVYGLGAAARVPAAVAQVFALKGRPRAHPLIVHLPTAAHLGEWAAWVPPEAEALAAAFWPGPLTLVLPRAAEVPDAVTGGQPTVALRVPAHPVARALLSAYGDGVAAPSANRFGRISPTSAAHVAAEFPEDLLVLDGGAADVGLESTILDLTPLQRGGAPRLLRPGGVPVAAIEAVLRQRLAGSGEEGAAAGSAPAPRVPGSLSSHYAARSPTRLVEAADLAAEALRVGSGAAVLAMQGPPAGFAWRWLELPAEPEGYGRGLYAAMRELDAGAPEVILVERVPSGPEWLAVRDRLSRAAARE